MKISSSAFKNGQLIPKRHTGEGEDCSPFLQIEGVLDKAVSLALIVDDPDAPMGTFVHWVAWNFESHLRQIEEGGDVAVEGINDFGEQRYRGPLPPPGAPHRYFFKLYALDTMLSLGKGSSKKELLKAMEGHILEQAELVGTYQR